MLRAALIRRLDRDTTERAVALIQAFIAPNAELDGALAIDPQIGADQRLRLQLLAWIGQNPESELYDPLLFDALKGQPPELIGVPRDPNRPGRQLNPWRGQDRLFALLLLAALIAFALLNPPLSRVANTQPPTREDTKQANETTNTVEAQTNGSKEQAESPGNTTASMAGPVTNPNDPEIPPVTDAPVSVSPLVAPAPPVQHGIVAGPFIVFFDWDKDEITPQAAAILDNAAAAWRASGNAQVVIAAHTDRSVAANQAVRLTQRMANNVRSYLAGRGIPNGVMTTEAFGSSRPLVPTADGVRELQNRRVEITFGPGSGW